LAGALVLVIPKCDSRSNCSIYFWHSTRMSNY